MSIAKLSAGLIIGVWALAGAGSALAAPPATLTEAVIQVIDHVCRPAADTQTSPAGFAAAAGYAQETAPPPNLPVGSTALSTWRAPSPEGRVYVMSGLFPESTTSSACLIAVYDARTDVVSKAISDYVLGLKRGFAANPAYNLTTAGMHMTRYDRRVGDTQHSVIVMDALDPKPGQPSTVFSAFVVDQSWMLHPGRH
jgi:hypothetical protein